MLPSGLTLAMTLTLKFQGQIWNLLCLSPKWSDCHESRKAYISIELLASNVTNGFDLGNDLDLWIFKAKCDGDLWPHAWPWPRISMVKFLNSCFSEWEGRLILNKGGGSRSFMAMNVTIWWPRSGVRIYLIVTGVTSDVGVSSTHLICNMATGQLLDLWFQLKNDISTTCLDFWLSSSGSEKAHLPGCFHPCAFPLNIGLHMFPSDSFMSCLNSQLGYSTGSSRLCNWLSLWCLLPWIYLLPPVCWSTFWEKKFEMIVGFVSLTNWRTTFSFFFIMFHIYLNASQYHNTLFSSTFMSQIMLYFLHSTLVLSFYIDVVLTLSVSVTPFCIVYKL